MTAKVNPQVVGESPSGAPMLWSTVFIGLFDVKRDLPRWLTLFRGQECRIRSRLCEEDDQQVGSVKGVWEGSQTGGGAGTANPGPVEGLRGLKRVRGGCLGQRGEPCAGPDSEARGPGSYFRAEVRSPQVTPGAGATILLAVMRTV